MPWQLLDKTLLLSGPLLREAYTKTQFSLYFVKSGKIDKKYGRLLSELFDLRQKGDYENVIDYDSSIVTPLFEPVDEMIKIIEKEIDKTRM